MSESKLESHFVGPILLFAHPQINRQHPLRDSGLIERTFAALADELAKEGFKEC